MEDNWLLDGATKNEQSITSDWESVHQKLIEGVKARSSKHVIKESGYLTEVFRSDWALDDRPVGQVFQVTMLPDQISAWHAHEQTLDRLFVSLGTIKIVLFDHRHDSPTHGHINEFKISYLRPTLIVVPPRVWHGIQNIGSEPGQILNLVDRAYQYSAPDHWRIPPDSPLVPYSW